MTNRTGANPNPRARFSLPTRKVGASGLAGALSIILVWSLNTYVMPDKQIPGEIASAITTVLTFLVGYLIPD
jgi:hypothetical protein